MSPAGARLESKNFLKIHLPTQRQASGSIGNLHSCRSSAFAQPRQPGSPAASTGQCSFPTSNPEERLEYEAMPKFRVKVPGQSTVKLDVSASASFADLKNAVAKELTVLPGFQLSLNKQVWSQSGLGGV